MENQEEKSLVEYVSRDGQKIKLSPSIIKKFLVRGNAQLVTNQELFLYMGVCKSRGMNPFINDCYLTKYTSNDPAAIIVSIDYNRKRARAQSDCRGWKTGIVVQNQKKEIEYREGCILLDNETLIGGWFEAKPDGWEVSMRKTVNLDRYIKKTKEGKVTRFWSKENQPEMIAKVAESQGLRATWPDEFQGLYIDAERESQEAQEVITHAYSHEQPENDVELDWKSFASEFKHELKNTSFSEFCELTSKSNNVALYDLYVKAVDNPDAFREAYQKWLAKQKSTTAEPEKPKEEDDSKEHDEPKAIWHRDNWINLKQSGFATFIYKNKEFILASATREIFDEMVQKWTKFYNEPCPLIAPGEIVNAGNGKEKHEDHPTSADLPECVHEYISTEKGMECQLCGNIMPGSESEKREDNERVNIRTAIMESFSQEVIQKAIAKTGISLSAPTEDALSRLMDACVEIHESR